MSIIQSFDTSPFTIAAAIDRTHSALRAEAMLIMTSIVRLGQSTIVTLPIDEDAAERIIQCIQTLAVSPDAPPSRIDAIFLEVCITMYDFAFPH